MLSHLKCENSCQKAAVKKQLSENSCQKQLSKSSCQKAAVEKLATHGPFYLALVAATLCLAAKRQGTTFWPPAIGRDVAVGGQDSSVSKTIALNSRNSSISRERYSDSKRYFKILYLFSGRLQSWIFKLF